MFKNHPAQYHVKFRRRRSRAARAYNSRTFSPSGNWTPWHQWEGEPGSPIVGSSFDDYKSARILFDQIREKHMNEHGFEIAIFYQGKIFYQH